MRRKMAVGNWKMNGAGAALAGVGDLLSLLPNPACEVLICPPATLLHRLARLCAGSPVAVGGQTCHSAADGAHTGDISAPMLAEAGASHVIVGHSERRRDHGESDADVRATAQAVWAAGMTAILCVGEAQAVRDAGKAHDIVGAQLDASIPDGATGETLIVAYEPVWAIGTGRTPQAADIQAMHGFIRTRLARRFGAATGDAVRILYGGSMNPANAAAIGSLANVDGGLIGGASLKAADFAAIIAALS